MVYLLPRVGHGVVASTLLIVIGFLTWPHADLNADAPGRPEPKLKTLQKERLAVLRTIAEQMTLAYRSGDIRWVGVREANGKVLLAELDLCDTDKERLAILEKIVKAAKEYEAEVAKMIQGDQGSVRTGLKAKADRLDAEIALERLRLKIESESK